MDEPAAMHKARALERFTRGCPKHQTRVTISDREAWELLAWSGESLGYNGSPDFLREMARAKATGDPWPVLEGFELRGFLLQRLPEEVN